MLKPLLNLKMILALAVLFGAGGCLLESSKPTLNSVTDQNIHYPAPTGNLSGVVFDGDSTPLTNATIVLVPQSEGAPPPCPSLDTAGNSAMLPIKCDSALATREVLTGPEGAFSLESLPAGSYIVYVGKPGYLSWESHLIVLDSAQALIIKPILRVSQPVETCWGEAGCKDGFYCNTRDYCETPPCPEGVTDCVVPAVCYGRCVPNLPPGSCNNTGDCQENEECLWPITPYSPNDTTIINTETTITNAPIYGICTKKEEQPPVLNTCLNDAGCPVDMHCAWNYEEVIRPTAPTIDNVSATSAMPVGICENGKREPMACTREYVPVCGWDGYTYSNACVARSMGTMVNYQGECPPRL